MQAPWLVVVGLLVLSCKETNERPIKKIAAISRPNIIFILADDLGYGDVGCYGQQKIQTPEIDQMANEGLRFTDYYAGNTVCAPSRASLLTGLHQGHAPVRGNNNNVLGETDVTFSRMAQDAGYETALIGKWGLGEVGTSGEPNQHGFDHYFGYLNQVRAHNYYPDYLIRNGQKVPLSNKIVMATEGYAKGVGQAAVEKNDYSHDLFIQEALEFLEKPRDRPFLLYLPLTIPHANNEGHLVAEHGMEVPDSGIYGKTDWPEVEKSKAAMISLLDKDVGRILDKLNELELEQNTLVIFTSDNGPHREGGVDPEFFDSNGNLRGIKRDLYEGGIRVPFIARWKGTIAPGTTTGLPSAFWDMLPTFAELMGVEPVFATDGISLLPTLVGKAAEQRPHKYLYWEFAEGNHDAQAVRSGRYKLLHIHESDSWELYDLSNDLEERHNLVETFPEIVERLQGYMEEAHVYDADYPLEGESGN
ncbi:arylsulfatase [Pelagihabitans pacificus]|nr:arylsulfatase [Pelagihabitans pacificus]